MPTREVNFDGLIGPTHNYAGLSPGNVPSLANAGAASRPRDAALQGLAKMRKVRDLGIPQGVLPPQQRPNLAMLRSLGFTGDDAQVLERTAELSPTLLAAAWSASSMWAANAATVSSSTHTADGRVHMTPANLMSHYHRMIEAPTTTRILRAIFADESHFAIHDALPCHTLFADEGAANHVRFAPTHAEAGVELFVFGFDPPRPTPMAPKKYKSRQSRGACETIVRKHDLDRARVVIARQHHEAIDAGVFHNDVISTGNENVFLYHELALADTAGVLDQLRQALDPTPLIDIPATLRDFSLEDAVASYVFNSQVLTLPDGTMMILAPTESENTPRVAAWLARITADDANPIARVEYIDVRESMRNGGGPACLRLRVPLTEAQLTAVTPGAMLTPERDDALQAWVERRYPEEIRPDDLADHRLARQCLDGLDELTRILELGDIYDFQLA
ncbi:MAG: N-succinylarginine dihydrolase [Phycisphaeraceae bacterium]|nr:MAG: N-succinylarginine dihydrolase [Phycisphaeraceae bacterium]